MKKLATKQQKRRELLSDKGNPHAATDSILPLALVALMFGANFGSGKPL